MILKLTVVAVMIIIMMTMMTEIMHFNLTLSLPTNGLKVTSIIFFHHFLFFFVFVLFALILKTYYCMLLMYVRETTDSYTIATAPSFGSILKGPSFIYSSFGNRSKSNSDIDGKSPFLSAYEKDSMQNLAGEMPLGHGCSFTQTIFNGM